MKKKLFLIRHGETEYNRLNIIQGGGVDSDLNETGRAQALAFYEHYKDVSFDVILTSTLKRTHQTVAPFLKHNLPWEQFPEINEMNWGLLEGMPSTPELHTQYRTIVDAWEREEYHVGFEGGESALDLAGRVRRFLDHLIGRPEEHLLICSHGRAMRCMVTLMQDLALRDMDRFSHANTGLYKAHWDTQVFSFELENDITHLEVLQIDKS